MGAFGIKPVAPFSIRRILGPFLSVGMAARVHRVPVDEFVLNLNKAVAMKEKNNKRR